MDLYLSKTTHDLELVGGALALVINDDLIAQRIKQRLWFFRGEWYLAVRSGVPYFQEVLVKGTAQSRVESILKAAIVGTEGVTELTAFDLSYDATNRVLTLAFSVRTDVGEITTDLELF